MNATMDKVLKRLAKEQTDNLIPAEYFYTQPIPTNKYEWHFTILGVEGSPFEKGIYHGYFSLPQSYPLNPPDVYFTTPNGRFHINAKICLNITGYHKEAWTPAWSLRTMVQAICAYMLVNEHGIGAIFDSDAVRKDYAKKSRDFTCPHCGPLVKLEELILNNRNQNGSTVVVSEKVIENESKLDKRDALEKVNVGDVKKQEVKRGRGKRVKSK